MQNVRLIPRIIHQTFASRNLPVEIRQNVCHLRTLNPLYEYRFYDDEAIVEFIDTFYSTAIQKAFRAIRPEYGAAKADLFRYLLMYKVGGVYLDFKSTALEPLDAVIRSTDEYLLAQWDNGEGDENEGWGLHPEVAQVPHGEFQQWHIIARPGHPFLKSTIDKVVGNIRSYKPWRSGVGRRGTLLTTGPVAYTSAITPILRDSPARRVRSHLDLGLRYSIYPDWRDHQNLSKRYYQTNLSPLTYPTGAGRLLFTMYSGKTAILDKLRKLRPRT